MAYPNRNYNYPNFPPPGFYRRRHRRMHAGYYGYYGPLQAQQMQNIAPAPEANEADSAIQAAEPQAEAQNQAMPLVQPFIDAAITESQSVADGASVRFPSMSEALAQFNGMGIDYNGIDTFTINYPGLYSLACVLALADNSQPSDCFYVQINRASLVAGSSNMQGVGQIAINQVAYYDQDTQIRIVNASGHSVMLDSAGNGDAAGHLSMYRFADNSLE